MRTERLSLQDMLSAIESIEQFIDGMTFKQFDEDDKTQSAVIRKFEVMGEATKNLPDELLDQYPDIPWKKMAGMRDRLIHGYFSLDTKLVWQTIQKELPPLKNSLEEILEDLPEE